MTKSSKILQNAIQYRDGVVSDRGVMQKTLNALCEGGYIELRPAISDVAERSTLMEQLASFIHEATESIKAD